MLFNAHVYYSIKKNQGVIEPLRIFGALLPDCALTKTISWTDLHNAKNIQAFAQQLPQAEAPLGIGLSDHYELDLRSHDAFETGIGYAFSHQTSQLRDLVLRACALASSEQTKGLAHNFIETGVDINLLRDDPTIQSKVRHAVHAVAIDVVAKYIADFFKTDISKIKSQLIVYRDLITKYDLQSIEGWIALWDEIVLLLLGNKIDKQATRQALLLATELTAPDYTRAIAP